MPNPDPIVYIVLGFGIVMCTVIAAGGADHMIRWSEERKLRRQRKADLMAAVVNWRPK